MRYYDDTDYEPNYDILIEASLDGPEPEETNSDYFEGAYAEPEQEYYYEQTTANKPPRTFFVTATIQIVLDGDHEADAIIEVKDLLNGLIETSKYRNDPMNGAIVNSVEELD